MIDYVAIATGAVSLLSPYLPHLLSLGGEVGNKLKDAVIDKGIDAAGEQAKKLWAKVTGYFGDDAELTSAAKLTAAAPQDAARQQILKDVLAQRLKEQPQLAEELLALLGGPKRLQQLIAGHDAEIKNVSFKMAGPGEEKLEAGDRAKIEGINFDMS